MLRSLNEEIEGESERRECAPRSLRATEEDGGSLGVVARTKWGKSPRLLDGRGLLSL